MNKKVMKLASPGRRLGAFCIDKLIPAIFGIIIWVVVISSLMFSSSGISSYSYGYGYSYGYSTPGASIAGSALALVLGFILYLAYCVVELIMFSKATTIGKAILGLSVVDAEKGEPLSFWNMVLREVFAKKASEVIFCIGYFWVLIDDKNRAWHDKIMDSYVVDDKESARIKGETANNGATPAPAPTTVEPAAPVVEVAPAPATVEPVTEASALDVEVENEISE